MLRAGNSNYKWLCVFDLWPRVSVMSSFILSILNLLCLLSLFTLSLQLKRRNSMAPFLFPPQEEIKPKPKQISGSADHWLAYLKILLSFYPPIPTECAKYNTGFYS